MIANINMKKPIGLDVSSRAARRRAMSLLLVELERVMRAEEAYMERVPENFRCGETYESAEYTVDILTDAIIALGDAF
jgi:hypothetical protein